MTIFNISKSKKKWNSENKENNPDTLGRCFISITNGQQRKGKKFSQTPLETEETEVNSLDWQCLMKKYLEQKQKKNECWQTKKKTHNFSHGKSSRVWISHGSTPLLDLFRKAQKYILWSLHNKGKDLGY